MEMMEQEARSLGRPCTAISAAHLWNDQGSAVTVVLYAPEHRGPDPMMQGKVMVERRIVVNSVERQLFSANVTTKWVEPEDANA